MIKGIVFDCFGVLTADLWHEFLATLPKGTDLQALSDVHRAYDARQVSKQECHDAILDIAGKEFNEMEDMVQKDVSKNTSLLQYIEELSRVYKIGLLSNVGTNWVRKSFLTEKEQSYFDAMVLSYEVGHNKPDQIMYTTIADKLGLSPSEILYIDDMTRYCVAAETYGMQAIQYLNFHQCKKDIERAITR
jgi:HAD superfamily hydrolase (TIGR01509 family)